MANICSNNYRFIFKDEATATKFSDFVAAQVATDSQGFPGYADTRIIKQAVAGKGSCDPEIRESIYGAYIERPSPNEVALYGESCWIPCPRSWQLIAKSFDDDARVFYFATEFGCDICHSNDPDEVGKVIFDLYDESLLPDWFRPEPDPISGGLAASMLRKLLGNPTGDLYSLIEEFEESEYAKGASIHVVEYRPICDWHC